MRELAFVKWIERIEKADALDPLVAKAKAIVMKVIQPQAVRDVLHGVPTGHPVHPLSVQIPIGVWTSAALLDLLPGTKRSAKTLVGVGVLSASPAVLSGYTDWSELRPPQQRVGIIHSLSNAVAITLYGASWVQRQRGRHTSGKALSYLGFGIVACAGVLGAHLSYRQAAGANHAEHVPYLFPDGWQPLGRLDELEEGALSRREVGGQSLLAVRRGASVDVLSNVCSHLSAPLNEGEIVEDTVGGLPEACVKCPWHGSVFALSSGEVVHGPATAPAPRFETRIVDGIVEVRHPDLG